ncbi:hypothetical protein C8F04DRAFT_1078287 [Mycena alexandri]|uniref:Uncharacterized protein n=1 Tax=Mycena alexandri TaxID=1745969 RepID=A0AAD6X7P1_9AGAR|nr:hypothetical protein C8F04DRAFT_1078287 [Mycena alexandri]
MHITSTINPRTQSGADDVPVVLVTLGGRSKLLARPSTYKEMQRLVRSHYDIDAHAGLQFEVSSWDICGGQNVEITESAYPHLVALLDSVFVVVAQAGQRDRMMPSPSATPPLRGDDEIEDERTVQKDLAPDHEEDQSDRAPKVESEEEQEDQMLADNAWGEDESASVQGDDDAEEEDAPHARQVLNNEFPSHRQQAREVARKPTPKARPETARAPPAPAPAPAPAKPRAVDNRPDSSAESSQMAIAAASSDSDERFKVSVTGPGPHDKAEFMTRRGHLVSKVLNGVCKTFKLDAKRAKLMLCIPMEDEDGEVLLHEFECANDETIARSGVKPNSKLIVRVDEDEEDEGYED